MLSSDGRRGTAAAQPVRCAHESARRGCLDERCVSGPMPWPCRPWLQRFVMLRNDAARTRREIVGDCVSICLSERVRRPFLSTFLSRGHGTWRARGAAWTMELETYAVICRMWILIGFLELEIRYRTFRPRSPRYPHARQSVTTLHAQSTQTHTPHTTRNTHTQSHTHTRTHTHLQRNVDNDLHR